HGCCTAPVEEVLTAAERIAGDYYHDRQVRVSDDAVRIARGLGSLSLDGSDVGAGRDCVYAEVSRGGRVRMIEVYRIVQRRGVIDVVPYVNAVAPDLPQGDAKAVADRMALHLG